MVALLLVVLLVGMLRTSNTERSHTVDILAHSGLARLIIGAQVEVSALVICLTLSRSKYTIGLDGSSFLPYCFNMSTLF